MNDAELKALGALAREEAAGGMNGNEMDAHGDDPIYGALSAAEEEALASAVLERILEDDRAEAEREEEDGEHGKNGSAQKAAEARRPAKVIPLRRRFPAALAAAGLAAAAAAALLVSLQDAPALPGYALVPPSAERGERSGDDEANDGARVHLVGRELVFVLRPDTATDVDTEVRSFLRRAEGDNTPWERIRPTVESAPGGTWRLFVDTGEIGLRPGAWELGFLIVPASADDAVPFADAPEGAAQLVYPLTLMER